MSDEKRRFPIQRHGSVPWVAAEEAYKVYSARYGTSQSLERLAERGGFGYDEFMWLLTGMHENSGCDYEHRLDKAHSKIVHWQNEALFLREEVKRLKEKPDAKPTSEAQSQPNENANS